MKHIKKRLFKIFTMIIFVLLFSKIVWAENWYAVSQYDLKAVDETLVRVRVVTRTFDKDRCYEAAGKKMMLPGTRWVDAYCFSGPEYDKSLKDVFDNSPAQDVYVSCIDSDGYEKVIDFPESLRGDVNMLAETIAKECENNGMVDVRIIHPVEAPEQPLIIIGSTREETRSVQGEPDTIVGNVWFYGDDIVVFNEDGKVYDYCDFSGELKAREL